MFGATPQKDPGSFYKKKDRLRDGPDFPADKENGSCQEIKPVAYVGAAK